MNDKDTEKITILFLCTGNSCRSQMAEGWAKNLKADKIDAYSAGIEKHGLNPLAVVAMAEAGVDISLQKSKIIDELPLDEFDWVITLCGHANETCPYFPGKKVHHGFDDPPQLALQAKTDEEKLVYYRRISEEIRTYIESLPESI